ncbi:MAG: tryptophan synthase subunit alpha, partial [Polaribacter sp.]|nr:tryptophan synthase subunit alpha [Polaribacter sp.]MDG1321381.1 tryptophan synthase subunit alpha [Polaribacter sp.]
QQMDYFKRVKAMQLKSKLIIGFGISDKPTFTTACDFADGAIIGSAFIKYLGANGIEKITDFIKPIIT